MTEFARIGIPGLARRRRTATIAVNMYHVSAFPPGVGSAGAVLGCVTLYLSEASEIGAVQASIDYISEINYVFYGFAMEASVHDLNELVEGKGNAAASLSDAFAALSGCVLTHLGYLIQQEDLE